MVDSVDVNIGAPSPEDVAKGFVSGLTDSLTDLTNTIRNGGNEVFMTATISIMLVFGFVTIWRRL